MRSSTGSARSVAPEAPRPLTYVVVGTDTGVGKTVVSAGLARAWADMGRRVVAIKPVETGWAEGVEGDGERLAAAARQTTPQHALQRFHAPLAPPQAAELEGRTLALKDLVVATRAAATGAEIALVESAGGLLSPLTWNATALDLIQRLGARALLVTADRLGTQNHTRLTLRVLADEGVKVAAVVLSAIGHDDASVGRNAAALARYTTGPLHVLPHVPDVEAAAGALAPLASSLAMDP